MFLNSQQKEAKRMGSRIPKCVEMLDVFVDPLSKVILYSVDLTP